MPVAEAWMIAIAAAGAAISALGSAKEGEAMKNAATARNDELKREAQLQSTAASESQTSNLIELNRSIGNIRNIAAARGLNPSSPSAMAIEGGVQRVADQNAQRTSFNARQQSSSLDLAGKAAMASGAAYQTAGYLKGAGSFLQAVSFANTAYQSKST